jgi:hypothetical protein
MVDNTNFDKESIMQKFSFTVDVLTDSPVGIDTNAVRGTLLAAVHGIGTIAAVHTVKTETMKEQGYKVWAKRVAGVSLATPKAKKVKVPKAEVAETVEA